ncbi:zinc finger MYM-type protein 1, partial [Tanacetum coccineum]
MSLILRYVNVTSTCVSVEEAFLGFLNVDDTTGQGLFDVTHDELKSLGLDIDNIQGQGYDNGSNMKGKHRGVQNIFLDINPRAFYTPFGLGDPCRECKSYQIRLQMLEIREALFQVAKDDNDTLIDSGANFLAENELSDFKFIVAIVIWFNILYTVNLVSKMIQSKDMLIDVAIKEMKGLVSFFKDYRETRYSKSIGEAKQIAIEMDIDPVFTQKRLKSYDDDGLMACCSLLEAALKKNYKSDVDANELCV